jgi:flagellar assembly factor FliW
MSALEIDSSRFGRISVHPEAVIEFPEGLIGLGGQRYTLIANNEKSPFLWLHSLDHGALALPVTNPDYTLEIGESEAQRLGIDESTPIDMYVTVRSGPALSDFAANLRAPIVIHASIGHQVINQAVESELRAPLFPPGADAASSSAA